MKWRPRVARRLPAPSTSCSARSRSRAATCSRRCCTIAAWSRSCSAPGVRLQLNAGVVWASGGAPGPVLRLKDPAPALLLARRVRVRAAHAAQRRVRSSTRFSETPSRVCSGVSRSLLLLRSGMTCSSRSPTRSRSSSARSRSSRSRSRRVLREPSAGRGAGGAIRSARRVITRPSWLFGRAGGGTPPSAHGRAAHGRRGARRARRAVRGDLQLRSRAVRDRSAAMSCVLRCARARPQRARGRRRARSAASCGSCCRSRRRPPRSIGRSWRATRRPSCGRPARDGDGLPNDADEQGRRARDDRDGVRACARASPSPSSSGHVLSRMKLRPSFTRRSSATWQRCASRRLRSRPRAAAVFAGGGMSPPRRAAPPPRAAPRTSGRANPRRAALRVRAPLRAPGSVQGVMSHYAV